MGCAEGHGAGDGRRDCCDGGDGSVRGLIARHGAFPVARKRPILAQTVSVYRAAMQSGPFTIARGLARSAWTFAVAGGRSARTVFAACARLKARQGRVELLDLLGRQDFAHVALDLFSQVRELLRIAPRLFARLADVRANGGQL